MYCVNCLLFVSAYPSSEGVSSLIVVPWNIISKYQLSDIIYLMLPMSLMLLRFSFLLSSYKIALHSGYFILIKATVIYIFFIRFCNCRLNFPLIMHFALTRSTPSGPFTCGTSISVSSNFIVVGAHFVPLSLSTISPISSAH